MMLSPAVPCRWCCRVTNTAILGSRTRWAGVLASTPGVPKRAACLSAPTRAEVHDELGAALRGRARRPVDGQVAQRCRRIWSTLTSMSSRISAGRPGQFGARCAKAALDFRWRLCGRLWGTQLINPMVEIVVAPQVAANQVNKVPKGQPRPGIYRRQPVRIASGIDRLEEVNWANVAMHGAWYSADDVRGLIGQSCPDKPDIDTPGSSGLHDDVSIARATIAPTSWLNLSPYRTRLDHRDMATRFADALASVSAPHFSINGGYIYTTFDPYTFFDQPAPTGPEARSSCRAADLAGDNGGWKNAVQRLDAPSTDQPDGRGGDDAVYEDRCFIFDLRYCVAIPPSTATDRQLSWSSSHSRRSDSSIQRAVSREVHSWRKTVDAG